jgi:hypothetical protein
MTSHTSTPGIRWGWRLVGGASARAEPLLVRMLLPPWRAHVLPRAPAGIVSDVVSALTTQSPASFGGFGASGVGDFGASGFGGGGFGASSMGETVLGASWMAGGEDGNYFSKVPLLCFR